MKILFLARSLCIGGAERQLVLTARGLHERGHEVKVAVFYANAPLEKELLNSGVSIIDLKKKNRWDALIFLCRLVLTISTENPNVIYSYLNVPNIFSALLKSIFPQIKIVWGVRASDMDLNQYDWLARFGYKIECKLSRFVDLIICNSFAGKAYSVLNGFPPEKTIVIPNGIDSKRFAPNSSLRTLVRNEWKINDETVLIGIVARLDPMKDHVTFLKSAASISFNSNLRFVIIGEGPSHYKEKLMKLAEDLGLSDYIIWAGARYDMAAVYNALDICCSSSVFGEGFSNSIAEAMLTGVPCVVTDVGDSSILVQDTGRVVPAGSANKLSDALKTLVLELSPQLRHKTRLSIESRFSIDKMLNDTSVFLLKLVEK